MKTPEEMAENQGWNEYDYLRNEAYHLVKRSGEKVPELERAFYEAISRIRWEIATTAMSERTNQIINALIDYPVALRAVMDANAIANEHLQRANNIKRIELMEKRIANENT
jgi:hypothetical protein